ncbi:hypothetical protein QLX67_13055, partial [Balneolaceae bacterium ANBcel3]|nr:hypothetical protein [Balneolaceae bacterium ANBcel3]
ADVNNVISLKYLIPISAWDMDLAPMEGLTFRPGKEDESFIFNPSGQILDIKDLITGFATDGSREIPIITPVKDSQRTKTHEGTKNVAFAIYYPAAWTNSPDIESIVADTCLLLKEFCSRVTYTIV